MTGPTGNFISPNYPQAHHMRAECFWLLTVARGSTVNIIFVDLDLEADDQCAYDYVEVKTPRIIKQTSFEVVFLKLYSSLNMRYIGVILQIIAR